MSLQSNTTSNETMLSKSGSEEMKQNISSPDVATTSSSENRNTDSEFSDKTVYAGQDNSTCSKGGSVQIAGTNQMNPCQGSYGNTQPNVSAHKLLEVILQNLHMKQLENKQLRERCDHLELKIRMDSYEKKDRPRSGREPVSRSKSAPESFQKHILNQENDARKSSDPQIFVFPETKTKFHQNSVPSKEGKPKCRTSDPVSEDGLKDSLEESDPEVGGSSGRDSNEFLSLKDSFHEPPGVSGQYFNNVINELMKTKMYLHNLQTKQKCLKCENPSENQMVKMREEIQQLRFKNQKLQRDLVLKEEEMAQMKSEPAPIRDESFELSTESEAEVSESSKDESNPSSQVSAEVEIQRLREELEQLKNQKHMIMLEKEELQNVLMKDNHEISRELIQLNDAYDKLKENVKILSTCLQEEKVRSKNIDEKLKMKTEETRKISAHLGKLRHQYEELQQEKNALEKTRSLEDTPSVRFSSPRAGSSEFHRSGGSSRSGEYSRYGSNHSSRSPYPSRSGTLDSYNIRPENWPPKLVTQNNLSSRDNEPKLSNLPQFGAASSPKFECPRCLRKFQVENSYLLHMQSCLD